MKQRLLTLLLAIVGLASTTWAEDHAYVDLGLPSGTLWATMNVGATTEGEGGSLFQWGRTTEVGEYYECTSWSYYPLCEGGWYTLTKYNSDDTWGTVDDLTDLEPVDDAATALWGEWSIPSQVQWEELANEQYTTMEWTTSADNYAGVRITSKLNGLSIFIPAAGVCWYGSGLTYYGTIGYYWTRNLGNTPDVAKAAVISNAPSCYVNSTERYRGCRIRPVSTHMGGAEAVKVLNPTRYDVDGSGTVTLADLTLLANALVGRTNYPVTGLTLTPAATTTIKGGTAQLNVKTTPTNADYKGVVWTTSDYRVATVSTDGLMTAVGAGTCTVTATTIDGSNISASCSVTVTAPSEEFIDMGLPSGTLWAVNNLGANAPEEVGDLYAWGETVTKTEFTKAGYLWYDADTQKYTKYVTDSSCGIVDSLTVLQPSDDAAYVNREGKWRMPSTAQWQELLNRSNITKTTVNGVSGWLLTSKIEGYTDRSLFIPMTEVLNGYDAGIYWTRELNTKISNVRDNSYARTVCLFGSNPMGYSGTYGEWPRSKGYPIRPVRYSE